MSFSKAQNIRVLPGGFETIFWNAYHDQFGFIDFWTLCLAFTVSGFNFMAHKCAKNENCLFQRFSSASAFDLKVVSKPFSKMFSMSDLGFTQFFMLSLASPKNIFNLFTEKCEKKKNPFSNVQNICFWLKGSFKTNF